jgi:chromosome segregation ATPase
MTATATAAIVTLQTDAEELYMSRLHSCEAQSAELSSSNSALQAQLAAAQQQAAAAEQRAQAAQRRLETAAAAAAALEERVRGSSDSLATEAAKVNQLLYATIDLSAIIDLSSAAAATATAAAAANVVCCALAQMLVRVVCSVVTVHREKLLVCLLRATQCSLTRTRDTLA